jgi:prophage regulatory protein
MPEIYLSDLQLATRYGVHRTTMWRWVTSGSGFPPPVNLSAGCTRWKLSDIEAWEASRPVSK